MHLTLPLCLVKESDKPKTTFSIPYGDYKNNKSKHMPFGFQNARSCFQGMMNSVLSGLQGISYFVYLDDIFLYGYEDYNNKLREVFEGIKVNNLRVQPDKCEFLRKEVTYLGHLVTEEGTNKEPYLVKGTTGRIHQYNFCRDL